MHLNLKIQKTFFFNLDFLDGFINLSSNIVYDWENFSSYLWDLRVIPSKSNTYQKRKKKKNSKSNTF